MSLKALRSQAYVRCLPTLFSSSSFLRSDLARGVPSMRMLLQAVFHATIRSTFDNSSVYLYGSGNFVFTGIKGRILARYLADTPGNNPLVISCYYRFRCYRSLCRRTGLPFYKYDECDISKITQNYSFSTLPASGCSHFAF